MDPVSVEAFEHCVGNLLIILNGRIRHHNVCRGVGFRFSETPDMELVDRDHTLNPLEVMFDIFDKYANRDRPKEYSTCSFY